MPNTFESETADDTMATRDWMRLRIAYKAALKSPDPRTQNGALLVGNGAVVGACNDFPEGVARLPERLERPAKYSYLIHAEQNAILTAVREGYKIPGSTLFCPWACCTWCARVIVGAGVSRVVVDSRMKTDPIAPWVQEIEAGWTILSEAGVTLDFVDGPFHIKVLMDGQEIEV